MSMSVSTSSSSSVPVVTETPENQIIDQISGVASNLASKMESWAQNAFAQTSQITSQTIGNFFQVSQNMLGMSNNLTGQYNNLFAPENAQLVADANSYASPSRMAVDMGQAGATAAQAGAAGVANSEEALRSYGIDPSSGRYAALDKAAAVQNAANVAGAENTQRNADIATGQRLRSEAVQVGAQLPAAIANINNTAIQANTGAENASLSNANTGRNLMSLPNDFLKTAMDVKLPLQGQRSQSQSNGSSSSPGKEGGSNGGGGGGNRGGGGGAPSGGGGPAWGMNMPTGNMGDNSVGRGLPGAGVMHMPNGGGGGGDGGFGFNNPLDGIDPGSFDGSGNIYNPDPNGASMGIGQEGTNPDIFGGDYGVGGNPFNDPGFGQTFGGGQDNTFNGMGGGTDTPWGNIGYDPSANQAQLPDGWSDPGSNSVDTNWGGYNAPFDPGGYNTSDPGSDFYAGDGGGDPSVGMATGGPVPPKPFAGRVSPAMSPSGGQRVDDVRAQGPGGRPINLNAHEFVIPDDVSRWKGEEFFQNLIAQSRKRRMTAGAQPTPTPQASPQPMR